MTVRVDTIERGREVTLEEVYVHRAVAIMDILNSKATACPIVVICFVELEDDNNYSDWYAYFNFLEKQ